MFESFKVTPDLHASKGKRFTNFIIDYAMQIVLGFIFGIVLALIAELTNSITIYDWLLSESKLSDYVFGIIILIIYYNIIEILTGRSIGKYITKTKVVMEDGSKPKFTDILLRTVCRIIPFEAFSFFGEEARGWHDSLSKTYVVDVDKFDAKRRADSEIEDIGKIPIEA